MSPEKSFLALLLDAPLMSWGCSSRFAYRTTLLFPTRSALTGMICAALGISKGTHAEKTFLEDFDSVWLIVFAIPRLTKDGTACSIRRLEDYHVTGGGYDRKKQPQWIPRIAESGKPCKDPTVSWRYYLMDAKFGILLHGPHTLLKTIENALSNPKWGVWFGRKACIPAAPIVRGLFPSEHTALDALGLSGCSLDAFPLVTEAHGAEKGTDTLMDRPLNFQTREFVPRRICQQPPQS